MKHPSVKFVLLTDEALERLKLKKLSLGELFVMETD